MQLEFSDISDIRRALIPLENEARERLRADGFTNDQIRIEASLDMRYVGQSFELNIMLPAELTDTEELMEAFIKLMNSDTPIEIKAWEVIAFRVTGFGNMDRPPLPSVLGGNELAASIRDTRQVILTVYREKQLFIGEKTYP